jgi:hypothetical protein
MTVGDEVLIAILALGVGSLIYYRGQRYGELKERVDTIIRRLDKVEVKQESDSTVIAGVSGAVARLAVQNEHSEKRVGTLEELQTRLCDDLGTIKQALVQVFSARAVPVSAPPPKGIAGDKQATAVDVVRVKEDGKTLRALAKVGFRALVVAGLLGLAIAGIPVPHSAHLWALT